MQKAQIPIRAHKTKEYTFYAPFAMSGAFLPYAVKYVKGTSKNYNFAKFAIISARSLPSRVEPSGCEPRAEDSCFKPPQHSRLQSAEADAIPSGSDSALAEPTMLCSRRFSLLSKILSAFGFILIFRGTLNSFYKIDS